MEAAGQGLWQEESGGVRALSQIQFGNSRPWGVSLQGRGASREPHSTRGTSLKRGGYPDSIRVNRSPKQLLPQIETSTIARGSHRGRFSSCPFRPQPSGDWEVTQVSSLLQKNTEPQLPAILGEHLNQDHPGGWLTRHSTWQKELWGPRALQNSTDLLGREALT